MAVRQDGDGIPLNSEILCGLTPRAQLHGVGRDLESGQLERHRPDRGARTAAMGMNLLLGPSLDVRTQPSTSVFDPGVNVFGGDRIGWVCWATHMRAA